MYVGKVIETDLGKNHFMIQSALQSTVEKVRDVQEIAEELEQEAVRLHGPRRELFVDDGDHGDWENASCPDTEAEYV